MCPSPILKKFNVKDAALLYVFSRYYRAHYFFLNDLNVASLFSSQGGRIEIEAIAVQGPLTTASL